MTDLLFGLGLSTSAAPGADPGEITCAYHMTVRVDERAGQASVISAPSSGEADLVGPPEAVAEALTGFVKLGFTAFNLTPAGPATDEQTQRLAREVIPAVRAAAGFAPNEQTLRWHG